MNQTSKTQKQTLHFDLVENQPAWGTWGIACKGDTLLVGNRTGVYLRTGESEFKVILEGFTADRMLMPTDDLCYVIGKEAITMLQKTDGEWKECAERIEGLGYPTVTHLCGGSAWIELGVHRVARISYKNGILKSQLFDEFPWKQTGWIHVGSVGDLVILCSPTEGRLFFDESKGEFVPTPPEWEFLENFPYLIGRLKQDASGRIWVSHFQGISQLVQTEGEYSLETSGFEFVRASYPLINIVDGKNVWFNTGTNLFHVNPETQKLPFKTPAPTIVTIIDQTTQEEILNYDQKHQPLQLDYRHNNLGIRLFAGSYAIRNPRYNIQVESQFPQLVHF